MLTHRSRPSARTFGAAYTSATSIEPRWARRHFGDSLVGQLQRSRPIALYQRQLHPFSVRGDMNGRSRRADDAHVGPFGKHDAFLQNDHTVLYSAGNFHLPIIAQVASLATSRNPPNRRSRSQMTEAKPNVQIPVDLTNPGAGERACATALPFRTEGAQQARGQAQGKRAERVPPQPKNERIDCPLKACGEQGGQRTGGPATSFQRAPSERRDPGAALAALACPRLSCRNPYGLTFWPSNTFLAKQQGASPHSATVRAPGAPHELPSATIPPHRIAPNFLTAEGPRPVPRNRPPPPGNRLSSRKLGGPVRPGPVWPFTRDRGFASRSRAGRWPLRLDEVEAQLPTAKPEPCDEGKQTADER